jgi:hypothetical protein
MRFNLRLLVLFFIGNLFIRLQNETKNLRFPTPDQPDACHPEIAFGKKLHYFLQPTDSTALVLLGTRAAGKSQCEGISASARAC